MNKLTPSLGLLRDSTMVNKRKVEQFTASILCPQCSALGVIVWENDAGRRSLVSLSKGFHERIARAEPYPIELVCNHCGGTQIEHQF